MFIFVILFVEVKKKRQKPLDDFSVQQNMAVLRSYYSNTCKQMDGLHVFKLFKKFIEMLYVA